MSLRFYMDHHVPAAITDGLINRGVDVLTTQLDGTGTWDDEALLERATSLNRVMVSQDRDMLIIADRWLQHGREFAVLIYAHQLAITIGRAVLDLELMANAVDSEDMVNRVEFLPL